MTSRVDGKDLDGGSTFEFDFIGETSGVIANGQSTATMPVKWNSDNSAFILLGMLFLISIWLLGEPLSRDYPRLNAFDLLSEIFRSTIPKRPAVADTDGFNTLASDMTQELLHA